MFYSLADTVAYRDVYDFKRENIILELAYSFHVKKNVLKNTILVDNNNYYNYSINITYVNT